MIQRIVTLIDLRGAVTLAVSVNVEVVGVHPINLYLWIASGIWVVGGALRVRLVV